MNNKMKVKLKQGLPVFGISIMIPSPQLVEMCGRLGFDWVLIDCEHGSITLETAELMAMAAGASGITPIVRPHKNDPEVILQYMDRGMMGIQAPHINSADEARRVVDAVKYHPQGNRSLAVGTRSSGYGYNISLREYTAKANDELLICVQIEDKDALPNIGSIAAIDGVDVLFVGPSDLSQSMGYPGEPGHPIVKAAIENAFTDIKKSGKHAGTAGNFDNAKLRVNQGINYYYTHLTTLLAHGYSEFTRTALVLPIADKKA